MHPYFNIVEREMIDMVPKATTPTMAGASKKTFQRELLQELYKPDELDELLKKAEFVVNRRKEVVTMVQAPMNGAEEWVFLSLVVPHNLHLLSELSLEFKAASLPLGLMVLRTCVYTVSSPSPYHLFNTHIIMFRN